MFWWMAMGRDSLQAAVFREYLLARLVLNCVAVLLHVE